MWRVIGAAIAVAALSGCAETQSKLPALPDIAEGTARVQPVYLLSLNFVHGKVKLCTRKSEFSTADTDLQRVQRAVSDLLAHAVPTSQVPGVFAKRGPESMVPPGTRLLNLQREGNCVTVALSREALALEVPTREQPQLYADNGLVIATEPIAGEIALAELVMTVTSALPGVSVQVRIGGRPRSNWGSTPLLGDISRPREREEFAPAFAVEADPGRPRPSH